MLQNGSTQKKSTCHLILEETWYRTLNHRTIPSCILKYGIQITSSCLDFGKLNPGNGVSGHVLSTCSGVKIYIVWSEFYLTLQSLWKSKIFNIFCKWSLQPLPQKVNFSFFFACIIVLLRPWKSVLSCLDWDSERKQYSGHNGQERWCYITGSLIAFFHYYTIQLVEPFMKNPFWTVLQFHIGHIEQERTLFSMCVRHHEMCKMDVWMYMYVTKCWYSGSEVSYPFMMVLLKGDLLFIAPYWAPNQR